MPRTLLATIDFPPQFGGVANYWANLVKYLPSSEVVVLAPEFDESLGFDVRQNYLIYRKNLLSKNRWLWPKWLPLLLEMYRTIRLENIRQVIVTHVLPAGTAAFILKKLLGTPYFVSLHGLDLKRPFASKRKRWLVKKILTESAGLIANSEFTKNLLKNYDKNLLEKAVVIYPCPNIVYEKLNEKKIGEFKEKNNLLNKKIILIVGRLIERKGHDKVIEAMPLIRQKFPEAVCLIVGQGLRLDYLKKLVERLGLTEVVKFFCDTMDTELPVFYESAHLFVMPCRELPDGDVEGFGIVFLEANIYSKAVIAGRSGGAEEAVINELTGLLIDPINTDEIADAVISLLTDEERAKNMGEAGRRRIEQNFSWPVQAQKLIKFLENRF